MAEKVLWFGIVAERSGDDYLYRLKIFDDREEAEAYARSGEFGIVIRSDRGKAWADLMRKGLLHMQQLAST